ncbi:hypothetical protein [Flavobacterium sp.]|uniref:hypothetical protein n=1 Tax=Flavobacterium sp. TaxID=239 RepID=UPI0039E6BFD3
MAKNTGLIKFTGKLGGLSGRDTPFGNIIQTPGGFKGDRIKTEARYEKTRQLYTEFGRCATLSSLFKRNLDFYLRLLPDPYVYNHIQKWLTAVKECDVASPKGEKTVGKGLLTEEGKALFTQFSFNRVRRFGFGGTTGYGVGLANGTLTFASFDTSRLTFPAGANSLGMQLILMRVDFENAECVMTTSEMVVLEKGDIFSGDLTGAIPKGDGVLVGILFLGFRRGEELWNRSTHNVLEIIAC